MKRFAALLAAMLLAFTACGDPAAESSGEVNRTSQEELPMEEEPAPEEESEKEALIPAEEAPSQEDAEEKAAQEEAQRQAAAQAEAQRQAAAQAEAQRQAAAQAEAQRQAAAQAEAERQAAAQAEAERQAAAQAEAERQAAAQAEAQRQAAAQKEAERQAAAQAEAERQAAAQKEAEEKAASSQSAGMKLTGKYFLSDVESEIIEETNAMRRAAGLGELTYNENLQKAARIRSKELYQNSYFAHSRPNGDNWDTVLSEDVPTPNTGRGENLAMATSSKFVRHRTADEWVEQWAGSPGHYENMMRPEFTHIGVGVYYQINDNGKYSAYATTIFGIL